MLANHLDCRVGAFCIEKSCAKAPLQRRRSNEINRERQRSYIGLKSEFIFGSASRTALLQGMRRASQKSPFASRDASSGAAINANVKHLELGTAQTPLAWVPRQSDRRLLDRSICLHQERFLGDRFNVCLSVATLLAASLSVTPNHLVNNSIERSLREIASWAYLKLR